MEVDRRPLIIGVILFILVVVSTILPDYSSDISPEEEPSEVIQTPEEVEITPDSSLPVILSSPNITSLGKETAFSKLFSTIEVNVTANIPSYDLPLTSSIVSNWDEVIDKLKVTDETLELLKKNGFVVFENTIYNQTSDMVHCFNYDLKPLNVSLFISSDSVLHMYHCLFQGSLMSMEANFFYDDIWELSSRLLNESLSDYSSTEGEVKEASLRNAAYFSVALSIMNSSREDRGYFDYGYSKSDLLKYRFKIPVEVKALVEDELDLIKNQQGFTKSPILVYREDYSQYSPRGHYTRSKKLTNYFLTMMWFGRAELLLKGTDLLEPGETGREFPPYDALISIYDADVQTLQACLIASKMNNDPELMEKWRRVYDVTSFIVAVSDDLGPMQYIETLEDELPESFTINEVVETYPDIKASLNELPTPSIYSGTGEIGIFPPVIPEKLEVILEAVKGFRFMGQRAVVDSTIFTSLVTPTVSIYQGTDYAFTTVDSPIGPIRGFPRGLDFMELLGSERAKELLDELGDSNYVGYEVEMSRLHDELDSLPQETWSSSLYWVWLHSIKPLLWEVGEGYPTFMRTEAWRDKTLSTALVSWTQLRHDTMLYAKQSYSSEVMGMVPNPEITGYVEPQPELYNRLLNLAQMTRAGLDAYGVLDKDMEEGLVKFEEIVSQLINISINELENKPLDPEDYEFIKHFGSQMKGVMRKMDSTISSTPLIADLHTDQNSKQILYEASGYIDLILVAYRVPDGRIMLGVGPVLSYYEFKGPLGSRLSDNDWYRYLRENKVDRPEWHPNYSPDTNSP